jgi:hypothetical protein
MPYEHHRQPLLPWPRFVQRMAWSSAVGLLLIAGVIFAPVVHRLLHALHADPDQRPRR